MLRAADKYACFESTAYSVGSVYGGKEDLYAPGSRPAFAWQRPGPPH